MRRALRALIREPITQFLLLGALLYGAGVLHARLNDPRRIVITAADVAQLGQRYVQQFGARPSPDRLEWLVERHIRDEVLYREGLALGLGKDDEVVRRRIVQKMEFLSEDEGPVRAPTTTELRAFYDAHAGRYRSPTRVSFTQLFFSSDKGDETMARTRAVRALGRLQKDADGSSEADRFWYRERLDRMDRHAVERIFGQSELAERVFSLPRGQWFGPLRSGYGWHLVRVDAREAGRPAPLAEIEPEVRADWLEEQRARRSRATLERLMRGYRIVREQAGSVGDVAPAEDAAPVIASAGG